jgi:undecaprenyl-diphosphatase
MNIYLFIISLAEGLTEFLPISSTAHLIVLSKIFSIDTTLPYIKFYLLFIQLGALIAGMILFSKKIITDKKTFINIIASFLPSAILGFIFYKLFKHLLEGNFILISIALLLGGLIFIYLEKIFMKKKSRVENMIEKNEISIVDAFVVGVAQALAIIPGVSRSGATIVAGILRGISKATIIEYTFLLAIPTLLAATFYDAYKSREIFSELSSYGELIIGFSLSFIVAFVTLYLLKKYLPRISLTFFGWYRIILSILILIFFI